MRHFREIKNKTIPIDNTTVLDFVRKINSTLIFYEMLQNLNLWPSFQIQKAKKECLPKLIKISDEAKVSLQSLLTHTAFRFIKLLNFD